MAQQKKLKTVRGSYTDLDLSIHAKKDPKNLVTHSLERDLIARLDLPEKISRDTAHSGHMKLVLKNVISSFNLWQVFKVLNQLSIR